MGDEEKKQQGGEPAPEKTFTQDEVNEMIKSRLNRENASWLKLLKVDKKEDVESILKNADSYNQINEQLSQITQERDELLNEKKMSAYVKVIEKYTDESDYVMSKIKPENDEKTEDYENRIVEFLKQHPSFVREQNQNQTKINSNFSFDNKGKAEIFTLKDAIAERLQGRK